MMLLQIFFKLVQNLFGKLRIYLLRAINSYIISI